MATELKKVIGKTSQCSRCGKWFVVVDENILFCSENCENKHDLLKFIKIEGGNK